MIIRDGTQSLEIAARERGPAGTPAAGDLGVNISVKSVDFSGRNDSVWIQRSDWNLFTEQLAQLERTRRGDAILTAMSPHDFQLEVFAADKAGHITAKGWVGRDYLGRNGILENRVSFAIEIDPSTLPSLAEDFAALAHIDR